MGQLAPVAVRPRMKWSRNIDHAAAAAVVAARAGDDRFARSRRDPRRLVDDPASAHASLPQRLFTASRSTPPSAARGRASVNATLVGRLNRAIRAPTNSLTCCVVYRPAGRA